MSKLTTQEKVAVVITVIVAFAFIPTAFFGGSDAKFSFPGAVAEESRSDSKIINSEAILDFEVQDLVQGTGEKADLGNTVYVHYVGQLEDGTTFDTSTDKSTPFIVTLGVGDVITGWDLGIPGMRVGGTRRLTIPPELAYGSQEIADQTGRVIIPADSTLIFDVVLLRVE